MLPAQDTVLYQRDSVIEMGNSTTQFFNHSEKTTIPNKITIITKTGKTTTMTAFLKSLGPPDGIVSPELTDYGFADLDNDGKKELVISNFTGGAHCCDEIYIFKNIGVNKYQHAAKLFAGNTIITSKNEFIYDLHEMLGYFFTCYACGYSDTSDAAPIELSTILLKYNKGKLSVLSIDKELRSVINDNLGKLCEQPYEKLDAEIAQDNGLRKEIAMNLAVFYYYFGKNIVETQKLFNKYYKYPDAKRIWAGFVKQLQYIRKDNDF
jgi:hypothetical protein